LKKKRNLSLVVSSAVGLSLGLTACQSPSQTTSAQSPTAPSLDTTSSPPEEAGLSGTAATNTVFSNRAPGSGWLFSGYNFATATPSASTNQGDAGAVLATITSGYGNFSFDHRSAYYAIGYIKPTDFSTLSFDINPGTTVTSAQQALHVTLKANTWSHVSIPVSALNNKAANYYQVLFFNNSNTAGVSFLMDHVTLSSSAVTPLPSPTPTVTPVPSATPSPSATPQPSATVTPTPTPTVTVTPSPTPTVTVTPTPSATPTATPTPSVTPAPTSTAPPSAGVNFTTAPTMGAITVVPNRDSAVVHVPFVAGAKDYRVLVLPAGASVSAASNGGEQVNSGNIFCAGERQHNAASRVTAYSEDKPWNHPQYTFKSLLGYLVNSFWDTYAGLNGVVARRTFDVLPEVMRDIEITGLTGPTQVYVEALDQLCPFTGVYGSTHKDIQPGGAVLPADQIKFSIYTDAEIKARYGSLIHNGHGPGAVLGAQGTTTAPHVLARSGAVTLTPDRSQPVPATFFDDFSNDADVIKPLDANAVLAQMSATNKWNGYRNTVDNYAPGGTRTEGAFSDVRQNSKWTFYSYMTEHADMYVKDGQLHTVLADLGQDLFGGIEMVPRKLGHLSDTSYLHVSYEVASNSTMRRYWMFNLCGASTVGNTLNPDGTLKAGFMHTQFFYQDTGSSPSLGGWNCIQAFTRDGTPFTFDSPKTVYHPIYDPSTDSENPATAKVQYYEEQPETDLDLIVNKPLNASQLPELEGNNSQVSTNLTVQWVGPVQYPSNGNVQDRAWFYQTDKTGKPIAPMLADQNLISPRTHFDIYVRRDRLVMYVNGKQRICNDLGSSKLTMAEAVPIFSQVLYHSGAERIGFFEDSWNRGQQRYYKNNTPFVDERTWDNIGFEENTTTPADFDSGYCFTPTAITNP
jgi:hypothetical protein